MQQFVGTYRIQSLEVKGPMLQITITNRTSVNSLLYDKGPSWNRETFGPGGNTYQTYTFTEAINESLISNHTYVK